MNSKEANSKLDKIISEIAQIYINDRGWMDTLNSIKVLNKAELRINNQKTFNGMEWIAAHLIRVLQDMVDVEALAEGRCGSDGAQLEQMEERQTRDSPHYEWMQCPKCGEQYPTN